MVEQVKAPGRLEIDNGFGVTLRELTFEDAQVYFDLIEFDRNHFYGAREGIVSDSAHTVEAVRSSLDPNHPFREFEDEKCRLGIWDTDTMVGNINYTVKNLGEVAIEISYWVGRRHIGNGYAARAVRTLLPHLQETGRTNIYARALPGNLASCRTLSNAGFRRSAISVGGFVKYLFP